MSLQALNAAQREAVRYVEGPCLVLAGAGSGKTRVITQKIAHLVTEHHIPASRIAALTFTNKAAEEMKARAEKLLSGQATKGLSVSTFHSLGVRILRSDASKIGLKQRFSIMDASDCIALIQDLAATTDKAAIRRLQSTISLWKNALLDPESAAAHAQNEDAAHAARIYRNYNATLAAYQAVDFDDLIRLPTELLATHDDVREKWQAQFHYLLVDEYQDTNACQYQLLKQLAGARAAFTAVGDDDQAIYAWRGASLENLRELQHDFPALKLIKLEQNYRSSLRILNAANSLITHNPKLFEKKLWSEHGIGDAVSITSMNDEEHEAEMVVMRLLAHRFERKTKYADYAILYRGNHQARVFEKALRREHVPYVLSGGQSFFERAEIRDAIAYLRLLVNGDDDPAFIRAATTPKRGIGPQTLEVLGKLAGERHASLFESVYSEHLVARLPARSLDGLREFCDFINRMEERASREPAGEVLGDLLKAIGYEEYLYDSCEPKQAESRWRNILDFSGWLARRAEEEQKSLIELAQTLAILGMLDQKKEDADAVRLSTLHAAKGLEFPHVFLVGVEEGLLPHRGGSDADAPEEAIVTRLEEERRLMYVGITRAQRSLHISWCKKRKRAREWVACEPSRFIAELGLERSPAPSSEPQLSARERLAGLKALLQKPAA